ncbi:acyltransferase family protein [Patulibacter defluvii]|uniref:acyltransferase family protein n=1 Tax=Patulibacter defluvii TaxID=3095358 RepID=UPI002A758F29|nr:acyltransferase [Patulibacter sp. DM4]
MSAPSSPAGDVPVWKRPWLGGDGARGLGALLVFIAHIAFAESTYARLQWDGLPGRDVYEIFGGELGMRSVLAPARLVNLFFAFSAYLLARPFLAWALGRVQRPSTWRFYVRRALRILPAYWALIALLIVWLVVMKGGPLEAWRTVKTLLLLEGGLSHAGFDWGWAAPLEPAWTVRVEVIGYVLLPLIALGWWLLGRRFGMAGLVAGVAFLTVLTLAVKFGNSQLLDGPGLLQWMFIPGLVVALVEAHGPLQQRLAGWRRGPTLWMTLAAFLLLIGSEPAGTQITTKAIEGVDLQSLPPDVATDRIEDALRLGYAVGVPMQIVGATVLLLGLIALEWQGGRPPIKLDSRVARWFGERSYSFYLVHFAVLGALLPRVLPDEKGVVGLLGLGVVAFAVSLALTVVLFRFVETPGMLLAAKLTGRRPPGPLQFQREHPASDGAPPGERS